MLLTTVSRADHSSSGGRGSGSQEVTGAGAGGAASTGMESSTEIRSVNCTCNHIGVLDRFIGLNRSAFISAYTGVG